jgi:hypothetical protein
MGGVGTLDDKTIMPNAANGSRAAAVSVNFIAYSPSILMQVHTAAKCASEQPDVLHFRTQYRPKFLVLYRFCIDPLNDKNIQDLR